MTTPTKRELDRFDLRRLPPEKVSWHRVSPNTLEPWMRAGDKALVSLRKAWCRSLSRIWTDAKSIGIFAVVMLATCASTRRIVDEPCLHVGVRPAELSMVYDGTDAYGLSVRVSVDVPCATTTNAPRGR